MQLEVTTSVLKWHSWKPALDDNGAPIPGKVYTPANHLRVKDTEKGGLKVIGEVLADLEVEVEGKTYRSFFLVYSHGKQPDPVGVVWRKDSSEPNPPPALLTDSGLALIRESALRLTQGDIPAGTTAHLASPADRTPAAIRPATMVTPPRATTFEIEVEKLVKAGAKRSEAVRAVVTASPKLHQDYLVRVNGPAGKALPVAVAAPVATPSAGTFEGEVERLVFAGLPRGRAIAAVVAAHPKLHARYIERVNHLAYGEIEPDHGRTKTAPAAAGLTWEGEVARLKATGLSTEASMAAVVREHPDLHREFLNRVNQ